MFDFDSDQVNRRYAPPGEGGVQPKNEPQPPNSVTRPGSQPVSNPDRSIPLPPAPSAVSRPVPPARERSTRRKPGRVKKTDWAWVVIAVAIVSVFVVLGLVSAVLINANKQPDPSTMPTPVVALPTPVDARGRYAPSSLDPGEHVTLDDGSSIILKPWDGTSRLNILMMGIDRRPGQTGLGYRSDTMMLVSFDPISKQLGILSIPRDLYVPIPGYNEPQRINTALALGELQRAGYGPTLAMQAVQYNLGVGVNAFVVADFTALIKLVDAIGGIDVNVPEPIADYQFPDMTYGYDPLILSAGLQHMDGYTAQKYARTRHGDSDFDRARRQQQVLFAIRDRILTANALPQLIVQAPSLYASISQNVYTGLTLDQMLQLALWLKDLPTDSIHTGVIDQSYVTDLTTADGAEVLKLIPGSLPRLLAQVFGSDYAQP